MSLFVENPTLAGSFLVGNLNAPKAPPQRLIGAGIFSSGNGGKAWGRRFPAIYRGGFSCRPKGLDAFYRSPRARRRASSAEGWKWRRRRRARGGVFCSEMILLRYL